MRLTGAVSYGAGAVGSLSFGLYAPFRVLYRGAISRVFLRSQKVKEDKNW